jgi:hypothetical protein
MSEWHFLRKRNPQPLCGEIADAERLTSSSVQNAMGPCPIHEVVPRAVRAAERMLTTIWMMVFQVSFFMVL